MPNPIVIRQSLSGVNYPASKADLIGRARYNGAAQRVIDDLDRLPETEYKGPAHVQRAIFVKR